ncbi:hypothetical protein GBAR_LOCUS12882 [Geodia barretti]|uniref:Uncharacterized protein n=1 Tax=Geodia barretti TaxID=519541 RepID=A0AA35S3F3_GEOBA|nr:hypothetical protein GBAR_LOCUS12882 [Geodia barretti]
MAAVATTRARLQPTAIRTYEIAAPAMQATCQQSPPRERGRKRPLPPPSTSPDKLESAELRRSNEE